MWIPPAHQGHDFQFCLFRGECKKRRSMEEVGDKRRTMVGTPDIDERAFADHSGRTGYQQRSQRPLCANVSERMSISTYEGADRKSLLQKLQYGDRSCSACRRRDENSRFVRHDCSPSSVTLTLRNNSRKVTCFFIIWLVRPPGSSNQRLLFLSDYESLLLYQTQGLSILLQQESQYAHVLPLLRFLADILLLLY